MDQIQYPSPKIQDIMNQRGKYKYFTKINLSIFYFCFEFDEKSKKNVVLLLQYIDFVDIDDF